MRIKAQGVNMELSPELRRHAESVLWMAAHRSPRRVAWAEASLDRDDASGRVTCRVDAWVREFGLVSARRSDMDPFAAVDVAAHQVEQAIVRRASRAGFPTLLGDRHLNDPGGSRDPDKCRSRGPTDGAESINRPRTNGHPFLDYDPVMPNWPK